MVLVEDYLTSEPMTFFGLYISVVRESGLLHLVSDSSSNPSNSNKE